MGRGSQEGREGGASVPGGQTGSMRGSPVAVQDGRLYVGGRGEQA